jgi:hypothetical protein
MRCIRTFAILTALAVLFLACDSGSSPVPLTPLTPVTPTPTPTEPTPTQPTTPVVAKVVLGQGSWGTAGDGKITDLPTGKKYIIVMWSGFFGVKADGTVGTDVNAADTLAGTEITGLINNTLYIVFEFMKEGNVNMALDLDADRYNTYVDISELTANKTFTITTSAVPPAVIIYVDVGANLVAETGGLVAAQELVSSAFKYVFSNTVNPDNVILIPVVTDMQYFQLTIPPQTGSTFTTKITVTAL